MTQTKNEQAMISLQGMAEKGMLQVMNALQAMDRYQKEVIQVST